MELSFGNLFVEAWEMAATVSTVLGGFTACWTYLVNIVNRRNLRWLRPRCPLWKLLNLPAMTTMT